MQVLAMAAILLSLAGATAAQPGSLVLALNQTSVTVAPGQTVMDAVEMVNMFG